VTGGRTFEEARNNAVGALEKAILGYLALGRSIPPPREAREDEETIALDPVTAARKRPPQATKKSLT
jgi:predicted RNase H-like HicB family nuclease